MRGFVPHAALVLAAVVSPATARYFENAATTLQAAEIDLIAPSSATTCDTTAITWTWGDDDSEIPTDTISLSIINASSVESSKRRKRASNRHIDYRSNVSIDKQRKRDIESEEISGAQSIPFDEFGYVWDQVDVSAGEYRIMLTIDSSQESVVSDQFYVAIGSDTSCLNQDSSSSSSTDQSSSSSSSTSSNGATSTSAPTTTSTNNASTTSTSSGSSVPVSSASSTSTSAANTSTSTSGQKNTQSDASTTHKSHKGAIAAGVLIAILAIAGAVVVLWWRRKRSAADQGQSSQWSEKYFGGTNNGGGEADASPTRGISGPQAASAAGLAAIAGMVPQQLRREKDEAALRSEDEKQRNSAESQRSHLSNGEHWVDFGEGDAHNVDGAQPLSPSTIDSRHFDHYRLTPNIGAEEDRAPTTTLYAQGQNVPLDRQSAHSSAMMSPTSDGHTTISSWGTPAEMLSRNVSLRDPRPDQDRLSAMTQGSIGRDLIAAMPQPPSTHTAAVSPFSSPEDAAAEGATSLQRSDSSTSQFGIKRKAVPRYSSVADPAPGASSAKAPIDIVVNDEDSTDPFADTPSTPTQMEHLRLSTQLSDSSPYSLQQHGAPPASVPQTPASISTATVGRLAAPESPDVPRSVGGEGFGSVLSAEEREREQYRLSIGLNGEAGFRISFS